MNFFERFDSGYQVQPRGVCNIIGTTAAIIGAAAIGAGSSVASGVLANKGANAQAKAATESAKMANDTEWKMYNQNRTDLAPWRNSGQTALNELNYLMGLAPQQTAPQSAAYNPMGSNALLSQKPTQMMVDAQGNRYPQDIALRPGQTSQTIGTVTPFPGTQTQHSGAFGSLMKDFSAADFQTDPGYEFRLAEGQKALDRSAAASGKLFSGGTLKANDRYNQDFASNEYGNAFNRFNTNKMNRYNMLSNQAGMGQLSASQTAQLGANTANNVSQNTINGMTQAANARASGYAATGNAIGGIGNSLMWGMLKNSKVI
jgi:hypothetical protein